MNILMHYKANTMIDAVMGFTTSTKTRPLDCCKAGRIHQEQTYQTKVLSGYSHEVKTFIWNNGKPQAMRSYHDDLIMSIAIACWVRDTSLEVSKKEIEYQESYG
jgi:hypothetical protein